MVPRFVFAKHGVEDDEEFAHASDEGDFSAFADSAEAFVEIAQGRVESDP